jgi:2-polyprenyl-3-methyl-5-hydroxy-6-metoxy-1,4-benzoquinol methylase
MNNKRHNYEYDVDVESRSAPANVVRMVGQRKKVLELGCGPGSITKIMAEQSGCKVTGLELDSEAIEKVTPYCVKVIQADLNSRDWPSLLDSDQKFDVVVAADVLEHLYDPWVNLQNFIPLINESGYIVISLPHVGHAAVMSCLYNGDFAYRSTGLLDRTHIRFFCLKNIEDLFAQAKLKIIEVAYVTKSIGDTEFSDSWEKLPMSVKQALISAPHSDIYQVVIKAVPLSFDGQAIRLSSLNRDQIKETEIKNITNNSSPRLIAFYLTQFHPTPENDLWWGKGFTEWTNVTKAKPLFQGHNQPHLPSDFGFYDLRLRETRREQISLAKQYGIDGFCYHYYWFSGKRILNIPLDDMLQDSVSDMPFCLCWANENWTRRWDGAEQEVLIAQKYLPDDDLNFIKSLVPFFEDKRYIRVDGSLYFIVYFPQHLPDAKKTLTVWREYSRSVGLGELHICAALTHGNIDYLQYGFDSGVEFPPHNLKVENCSNQLKFDEAHKGGVYQYSEVAKFYMNRKYTNQKVFKTVFPSWDNTARTKERALIVLNGHPENYEFWLSSTIDDAKKNQSGEQLVFINAWNEWAEGCHLEPDRWFGHGFLEATLNAKMGMRRFTTFTQIGLPHEESLAHRTFLKDMISAFLYHANLKFGNLKRAIHRRPYLHKALFPIVKLARKIRSKMIALI